MTVLTASQQRLFENAVVIAATRLLFETMRQHFVCSKLSEIITIHNGQGLIASQRNSEGTYDVYAAGGLVGRHSDRLTDKPFVVIGRKGSAGKPTYAPNGGWVIDTAYYAQPNNEEKLDSKFLFYALSSLDFTADIISTAIPGINRTSIYRYTIPVPPKDVQLACVQFLDVAASKIRSTLPELPSPLTEQRRIVTRIEELAAKIAEARGLRASIDTDIYATLLGSYREIVHGVPRHRMDEVAPLHRRRVDVQLDKQYHELGIRCPCGSRRTLMDENGRISSPKAGPKVVVCLVPRACVLD
jgi:hypothetical protein